MQKKWHAVKDNEFDYHICHMVGCFPGTMAQVTFANSDTAEANARLIAAAPDLLAMVKRYRKETPLGNQPHMIAGLADDIIAEVEAK